MHIVAHKQRELISIQINNLNKNNNKYNWKNKSKTNIDNRK